MGQLVPLAGRRRPPRQTAPRAEERGPAAIYLFTGVRYEREPDAPAPCDETHRPNRPGSRRRRLS